MTEILCKWLNDELKLSRSFDKSAFSDDFSSGYHLGEILHRYQLQDDFESFSSGQTADAKLNNFTRLEPTLHLLQIPFDSNIAFSIMKKDRGIATRLLYQLYVALQRKEKSNLTGAAMETMRAPAPVHLEGIESGMYKERLKVLVPRQTDITIRNVSNKFAQKREESERKALAASYAEREEYQRIKQQQREAGMEKSRRLQQEQNEMMAKIQAAVVEIPKPPPSKTLKAIRAAKEARRAKYAASTMDELAKFETNLKKLVAPVAQDPADSGEPSTVGLESSMEYLKKIKDRLEEDSTAREERAKRRRKVLVDQMKAHHAQEESLRQEQVVQRLMRQSQQERRIAVQLLQARREKEVVRKNRIFLEKQIEERRLKDFQDALDKEAELAKLAQKEYEEEIARELALHKRIMGERERAKYAKNYESCGDVLQLIIEFACKIAEYRQLTDKKVPAKFMREWRELLLEGKSLYVTAEQAELNAAQQQLAERNRILDEQDYAEYQNFMGEWIPSEEMGPRPVNNNVFGHILHRMYSIVQPDRPFTPPPSFPQFPVKAAVLGHMFSGKTTLIRHLVSNHRIVAIQLDQLLSDAVREFEKSDQSLESVNPPATMIEVTTVVEGDPTPHSRHASFDSTVAESVKLPSQPNSPRTSFQDERKMTDRSMSISSQRSDATDSTSRLSVKARLGARALMSLRNGEPVEDQVLVEIVTERLRRIPDGTGWILDGFPATANQAALLEKALTGREHFIDPKTFKRRKSIKRATLVKDPKPTPSPPHVAPGLDVVIVLDVADDLVIKRSNGRTVGKTTEESFHQEFKPPPGGSQTGIGSTDQVVPVVDPGFDREQVQNRICRFHDNWPTMAKFYKTLSTVCHVDASRDSELVYHDAERALFESLEEIQAKSSVTESVAATAASEEVVIKCPSPVRVATPSRSDSAASRKSQGSDSSRGRKVGKKDSGRKGKGSPKSGGSRSGSLKGKGSPKGKGKKSRTPSPMATPSEPDLAVDLGPPKPQPGDPDWEYTADPLPQPLVRSLVPFWQATEDSYVETTKHIFNQIRSERETIVRYLYEMRENFKEFLQRPDNKQPFVHSWQIDYNSLDNDLREDEETKAEMHQRVDDLCERMWDICDTRKEESEAERSRQMTEGWMEDHLGVLANFFLMLMQAEMDRFADSINVMRDYYAGLSAKVPAEIGPADTFTRLPILNLEVGVSQVSSNQTVASDARGLSPQASHDSKKSGGAEGGEGDLPDTGSRTKIPIIQRGQTFSSLQLDDPSKAKKGGGGKGAAPAGQPGSESPAMDDNPEEKTIGEAHAFACNAVLTGVQSFINDKEADDEKERVAKEEAEKAKLAAAQVNNKGAAAGKKGSGKAKGGKKGGKASKTPTPTPSVTAEEESPEQKLAKEKAIKMKDEYFIALRLEENRAKYRLDLVKERATHTLHELKSQAESSYQSLHDWLGARYLQEMAAIEQLSAVARRHIEQCQPVNFELCLQQQEFYINTDVKVVRTPSPPPRPPPVETSQPDSFTVVQLLGLQHSFYEISPGGLMGSAAFTEVIASCAALSYGMDALPDMWMGLSPLQLLELGNILAPDSNSVDWRKFLFAASQPPRVTQEELLRIRSAYVEADVAGNGWISKDQYDQVELWFPRHRGSRAPSPDDPEEPYPYNREENLHDFYFQLFADPQQSPARVDYINMMLYFAMDRDPVVGFFNALVVGTGKPMPRILTAQEKEQAAPSPEHKTEATDDDALMEFACDCKGSKIEVDKTPASVVPPHAWHLALHHNSPRLSDSHRFSPLYDSDDNYTMEHLEELYKELDSVDGSALPIQILMRHLVFQDAVSKTKRFQLGDVKSIFSTQSLQVLDQDDPDPDQVLE